jgi:hypothetical protein
VQTVFALVTTETFVNLKDEGKLNYILNANYPSLGSLLTFTEDDVVRDYPNEKNNAPGHGMRFSQSTFYYDAVDPGKYMLLLLNRSKSVTKIGGIDGRVLKRSTADCRLLMNVDLYFPKAKTYLKYYASEITFPRSEYAFIPHELVFTEENVTRHPASVASMKWLSDQLEHAQKEPAPQKVNDEPDRQPDPEEMRRRLDLIQRLRELREPSDDRKRP